jgi:tagatose-1,6-bisphosphate aldolase non-catalytic subunit AgaZ/GatZ
MHRATKEEQMDTSVNMKMTPAEHRLLVSAVEEAKDNATDTCHFGGPHLNPAYEPAGAREKSQARERAAQLTDLLRRL